MIAKRITSKAAKPRMARLVKYIVDAEGKLDPRSWERTADYILCIKTNKYGEKVGGVRVTNCHTEDPAAATTLIEATQAANTRSKTEKTYHLVFSFPPGEEPPLEILHKIEDELVRSIGYADHQRISAVHIDTDHLHVHVAINKVHPKGYQNIEPYFDKKKLMEACDRLELEYGLTRTNHGLTGQEPKSKMKEKQAQAEAHSGIESLQGHVSRDIAPRLKEVKTWQDTHAILAKHGLQIKKRGAGLVIGSGNLWVRASNCDRDLSLKHLSDRLGPYMPPASRTYTMQAERTPYEPKPKSEYKSSAALFAQYQSFKAETQKKRDYIFERLKYEDALKRYNLKKWKIAQRALAKMVAKGPARRLLLKTITMKYRADNDRIFREATKKRKALVASPTVPNWQTWLTQQAENGNTEALAVLRSRQEREVKSGNVLSGNNPKEVIQTQHKPQADKNGSLSYQTTDGGIVIDRKTHVQAYRATAESTLMALELAAKRFSGQALVVEGSEEFKKEVARLANIRRVNVRFADTAMEQTRNPKHKPLEAEI